MARVSPARESPGIAAAPPPPDSPDFHAQKSSDSPASEDHSAPSPWPALPDASPSAHPPSCAAREFCFDHPAGKANPPRRRSHSPPHPPHTAPGESVLALHPPASLFYRTMRSTSHTAPPHPASTQSA